jgi:lactoylglutathione lyase
VALSFRYSGWFVADVPATVAFYEKAFGFALRYMEQSEGYAELDAGGARLAFVGEKFIAEAQLLGGAPYAPNRRGQPAAGAQLAFVTDEFERDWRRAVEAGATIVKAPEFKPWGQTTGYLRDCNGTIVELCTPSHRDS